MKKMLSLVLVVIVVIVTTFIASSTMKVVSDNEFIRDTASLSLVEGDVGDVENLLVDYRNGDKDALSKMFRAFHADMGPEAYEHHVRMIWATQRQESCSECEDFLAFCSEFDIK